MAVTQNNILNARRLSRTLKVHNMPSHTTMTESLGLEHSAAPVGLKKRLSWMNSMLIPRSVLMTTPWSTQGSTTLTLISNLLTMICYSSICFTTKPILTTISYTTSRIIKFRTMCRPASSLRILQSRISPKNASTMTIGQNSTLFTRRDNVSMLTARTSTNSESTKSPKETSAKCISSKTKS